MIINTAIYNNISSNIVAMRQNTIAIRKTLLRNRNIRDVTKKTSQREDARITETKKRRDVEQRSEASSFEQMLNNIRLPNWKMNIRNPLSGFNVPGLGIIGGVISFFGYGLLGWMLNKLPQIVQSVQDFMVRAKDFLNSLTEFWDVIRGFFESVFNAIEGFMQKLGFGGTDALGEGSEARTKRDLEEVAKSLRRLIEEFPTKVADLVRSLVGLKPLNQTRPDDPGGGGLTGSVDGIDIGRLANAMSSIEGDYDSVGVTVKGGGHALGRYQFMSYRKDVEKIILRNARSMNEESKAKSLLTRANGRDQDAARQLLKYFPPQDQDDLFKGHATNLIITAKRRLPGASAERIIEEVGRMHIGGTGYTPGRPDALGTTPEKHGKNLLDAYKRSTPTPSSQPAAPSREPSSLEPSGIMRPESVSDTGLQSNRTIINATVQVEVPAEMVEHIRNYQAKSTGADVESLNKSLGANIFQVDGDNVQEGLF